MSAAQSRGATIGGIEPAYLLMVVLLIGAAAVAFGAAGLIARNALAAASKSQSEVRALRAALMLTDSVVKSEPQILVLWDRGEPLRILASSLGPVAGVPTDVSALARFGEWLDAASATSLKQGLDNLFETGSAFTLLLCTRAGAHLEASGYSAGPRTILRLRNVAEYKRELVQADERVRVALRDLAATRSLADALPAPAWTRDESGRIVWANKAYVQAVECKSLDEVCERQIELLEQRQRKAVAAALAKSDSIVKRMQLVTNGERRPHEVTVSRAGDMVHAVAIDASALEKAESELNRQMTTYDRTLDRVRTAAAVFDGELRLTFFNEAFRKLWQLDGAWLDTKPTCGEILDRLHGMSRLPATVDYRAWRSSVLAGSTNGQAYDDWWQLPDGRLLHVIAEQRHDGGVTYLYDDATERLALESRYNALIDVQRETLDSLKEAVAVLSTDGRLKLFNSAFLSIWRLPRELLDTGPHIDEIIAHARTVHDDSKAWSRLAAIVTSISDERESIHGQMVRADQTVIDYATTPLPDGATMVTFVDVTASKRYERALEERNEALVAADKLKNQVIGNVSYELRTPLTNIIGFTEMLSSPVTGPLAAKQREYLSYISSSSSQLLSIIDDILDLANIDAGMLQLKLGPVSAQAIVDGAILGIKDRAQQARLTIDIATAEDDIEFIADEARVRQVIYNLLSNAVGFSQIGGTVSLSVWREAGMVAFAVEDQGVGIPKEEQGRVFERFESRSHGSKHRGVGLGLSIVKSLVDLHHGDMQLDSEPGRGTRVTVRFPENPVSSHADQPQATRQLSLSA